MKKQNCWAVTALVTITLLGGMTISCKNNPKKGAQQLTETKVEDTATQASPNEEVGTETNCYEGATDLTKKWFQGKWEYLGYRGYYTEKSEKELLEWNISAGMLEGFELKTLDEDTRFYFLKEGVQDRFTLTDGDIASTLVIRKGGKYIDNGMDFGCYIPDPRDENCMLLFGSSTLNGKEVFAVDESEKYWRKAKN